MVHKSLKQFCLICAIVLASPLWIASRCYQRLFGSECLFVSCAQFLCLFPGMTGVFLRRAYYFMTLASCASDVFVEFGTYFSHRDVTIGTGVYIGARCTIGMCRIDEFALIGSNVDILSGRRQHGIDESSRKNRDQPNRFTSVHIGRNVWLGNSSVIMADVGENAIIGAGSVLVHVAPSNAVVAGNPAVAKRTFASHSQDTR